MKTLLTFSFICLSGFALSQLTKKVLVIGVDGCRSDALIVANTPNMDSLANNGVFSLDALNADITISGPGWSGILCGVRSDKHLVTDNNFAGNDYATYPSFFKRINDFNQNFHTVSFCHWAPINDNIIQNDVDFQLNFSSDAEVSSTAATYLAVNDPDAMFLHFDDVDHAGHSHGFSPGVPEYISTIETTDSLIGPIVQAIRNRPTYDQEDWLIILTSDHGGVGTSHGGTSIEHRQVPMIVSGDQITNTIISKDSSYVNNNAVNCLGDSSELFFDGANDFVQIPNAPNLNFGATQDFTVECRVRTTQAADVAMIGNKNWNSGINPGFVFSFELPAGPSWKINIGDGSDREDLETGGIITDNEWHTLSGSFDRDGYLKMYQNGVLLDSVDISGIGDINTNEGIFVGADVNSAYDFNGSIAEVRIWETVLGDQAINDFYCSEIDGSHPNFGSLIGYWKMNEGTGTVVSDFSPSTNHGTINDAVWQDLDSVVVYNYDLTPRLVDVPSTVFTHLCIPIDPAWNLDGSSLIPEDCSAGIGNLNTGKLKVYPIPVGDALTVEFDQVISDYTVLDVSGKEIECILKQGVLDVSSLPSGIYYLQIRSNNANYKLKFVKN